MLKFQPTLPATALSLHSCQVQQSSATSTKSEDNGRATKTEGRSGHPEDALCISLEVHTTYKNTLQSIPKENFPLPVAQKPLPKRRGPSKPHVRRKAAPALESSALLAGLTSLSDHVQRSTTIAVEGADDGCVHTIVVTTAALHADVVKRMVHLDLNISPLDETVIQSKALVALKAPPPLKTKKQSRDSKKHWGASLKRGCLAEFTVKTLYLQPHVSQVYLIQPKHVNLGGNVCHGLKIVGDRGAMAWKLSEDIKDFVVKQLHQHHNVL